MKAKSAKKTTKPASKKKPSNKLLELIVQGLANKQIAYTLNIAEHTVKNHVKHILGKLGVQDRTQAVTAAIQRGIIHLP